MSPERARRQKGPGSDRIWTHSSPEPAIWIRNWTFALEVTARLAALRKPGTALPAVSRGRT
jgi:hypothetical protein